ncbi:unnamed protein product (macronuclear) [Paramecium tetraurelia]|uniref:Phosphatidic acid phosphatase type 2/haloperoxidase domain-containing protein n=1 Tax=Paramecium tetraurelia TaxID=5888 RepID=A0EBE0_PARTE|nr:uncharacterized protein GSPATT00025341001 [Paramecium tetraurelia]CAK92607.1 unnamed protein product [Paramecium tetraurelia]|eukprot:XP_001460004.1 hypothetical protein (macronuclear) [Paramecium tetraurelia strain d4-2]
MQIKELTFYVFSTLGDRSIMYYTLIFFWLKQANKLQTLQLIIMYSISSFFGDFVKMILQQPRPFYIDNTIQLDFCQYGFGGPSGHACRALVFYVILFNMLQTQDSQQSENSHQVQSEELYLMIQPEQSQSNEISWKNRIIKYSMNSQSLFWGSFFELSYAWMDYGIILVIYFLQLWNAKQNNRAVDLSNIERAFQEAINSSDNLFDFDYHSIIYDILRLHQFVDSCSTQVELEGSG